MSEYPIVTCRICGAVTPARYAEMTRARMVELSLCFTCLHWHDWVVQSTDPNACRILGVHYYIDNELPLGGMRGFGGRTYIVRFNDGRMVRTTNLWCQGEIPEHFRTLLPDNAVFVSVSS